MFFLQISKLEFLFNFSCIDTAQCKQYIYDTLRFVSSITVNIHTKERPEPAEVGNEDISGSGIVADSL